MNITIALIDKLLRLRNGESLPSSSLRGEWVEELLREGVLVSRSHGSKRVLVASQPLAFERALASVDERLGDLKRMRVLLTDEASRASMAAETGNSKLVAVRSCPGFMVNSYEPILCKLNGADFVVNPVEGSMVFVADWERLEIPEDVIVVGIENMENYRKIRQQRAFFEKEIDCRYGCEDSHTKLLFVSRYPQSTDLRQWLSRISNRYVHFGDFDLAGIHIFLTEFHLYLDDRASFLIPSDIEERLQNGSAERYANQYVRFKDLNSEIPKVQLLIDIINKYHKGYDQEGYILYDIVG